MIKRKCFLLCLVVGLITSIVIGRPIQVEKGSQPVDILERQVSDNDIESLTTSNALRKSLLATKVPGGIVHVPDCSEEPIIQTWKPLGSSLKDVLDTIVATDSQYRWEIKNGVINLLPASAEPDLLRVHIKSFHVKDVRSVYWAYSKLFALPEVRKAITELKLNSIERLQGASSSNAPFTIQCKNVTLREALNAIVQAHGQAVWSYKERNCNDGKLYSIEFLVQ